jgi:hypothetical protein
MFDQKKQEGINTVRSWEWENMRTCMLCFYVQCSKGTSSVFAVFGSSTLPEANRVRWLAFRDDLAVQSFRYLVDLRRLRIDCAPT